MECLAQLAPQCTADDSCAIISKMKRLRSVFICILRIGLRDLAEIDRWWKQSFLFRLINPHEKEYEVELEHVSTVR